MTLDRLTPSYTVIARGHLHDIRKLYGRYIAGRVSADEVKIIDKHVRDCRRCQGEWDKLTDRVLGKDIIEYLRDL